MNRTITTSALMGVILFSACGQRDRVSAETPRPNFILIYTDEMQFSDLGCYGGNIPTPNIDLLAKQGIRFTGAYTTASMCTPSRYSVLTGQFPGRCTAASFLEANPADEPYSIAWNTWITPERKTLPRVLGEHGYVTGMSGKWHVGQVPGGTAMPGLGRDDSPDDPEVDRKLREQQRIHQELVRDAGGFEYAASVVWANYDNHPLEALRFHNFPWMAKGAMEFLEQQEQGGAPFFLYLASTAVHGPGHRQDLEKDVTFTPGGRDGSVLQWQLDVDSLLAELEHIPGKDHHRYAGMAETDHLVGLVSSKLKEKGLSENTVIIFMADHNIEPGKATSYEKGINVPLIIYWPGKTRGYVTSAPVQNIDLYPTLLEGAGIPLPADHTLDGTSLMPLIDNPSGSTRKYVFAENGYTRSVCDGRYKYIALRFPGTMVKKMRSGILEHAPSYVGNWPQAHSAIAIQCFPGYFDQDQLYDLEADPYEQENIYDEMAGSEVVTTLREALAAHLGTFRHPFPLEPDPFLESEAYRNLTRVNRTFNIYTIPWLSRDHGAMVWPPEE